MGVAPASDAQRDAPDHSTTQSHHPRPFQSRR
jgi:hypothetical protein